jgi:hypothetical protein
MAIQHTSNHIHWNYFLALEEDLDRLSRFVDFSTKNDGTFSLEIARLLLGASAEVDVVLKQVCKRFLASSTADTINAYFGEITTNCPNFVTFEIQMPRYGLTLQPWASWAANTPPLWWSDHNKVKHNRATHFERATLKNCLNSLAGLFVAVLHLYESQAANGELLELPRLFNVGDNYFAGTQMGRYGHSFKIRVR